MRGRHLDDVLEATLGSAVVSRAPVGGGCINEVDRTTLGDGRSILVKTHHPEPPPGFFGVEAAALAWLAEAATPSLRLPSVLAVSDGNPPPSFLAVEWIDHGPRSTATDEALGRGLAGIHRAGAPSFGWDRDGYIGDLPQPNGPLGSWAEFYATRRLEPLARRAIDERRLPADTTADLDRLLGRLPDLVGPDERPSRLHGDLWSGNLLVDADGLPWLIDPAPYGGHREVDLAMMRLFGGFGPRCFAAYEEAHPLASGHEERTGLYQLYPLLVHVTLFGHAYVPQTLATLRRYT